MFGIYIHFPYCVHKCSYCDFYSIENLNSRNKFSELLCKEIELRAELYGSKIPANTLFFGGGTPSLMKPHHIERIFETLHKFIDFAPDTEMTMECNPGTIDIKHMKVYKELGINRISFGVQSFIERDLKFLERIHSPNDVFKAVETAREVGFDNISIDLMFALPNQTSEDWKFNLEKALELNTQHISAYSLIYEPGTPLYEEYIKGKITPQDEDSDTELYELTEDFLSNSGFKQYEISNFAKDGYKCRHNLKYWDSGEYFGFGPSAHGYLNGKRYWNFRSNDKYFQLLQESTLPTEASEILTFKQQAFEAIYLGLRAEGLDKNKYFNKFGIDIFKENEKLINLMSKNNLLYINDDVLRLTNKGYFVSDNITIEFSKCIDNL
jgi:oxygen-independent coproporphyrinogen-3 oxidase